jgi:putative ABC transport system permease protein
MIILRLSLATIRMRWVSFTGAFAALAAGVAVSTAMLLALAAAAGAPSPGPQRFAAAPVVVLPHDTLHLALDGFGIDLPLSQPAPLPPALVARLSGLGATVADHSFAVHTPGGPGGQAGHGWSSAALGRYRLIAGHAPARADQIVLASQNPALAGRRIEVDTPAGRRAYLVSGVVAPRWFESAVFFTDGAAAAISPATDAVAVFAAPESVRDAVGAAASVLTGPARTQADPDPGEGHDQVTATVATTGNAAAVIIFVAVFVVFATFAFVADLRRREMALLRLTGATARQVRRMVIGEAALIGVIASLAGGAAGVAAGAAIGRYLVSSGVAPGWFTVGFAWWPVLAAGLAGLIAALAGAAVTAVRAGLIAPIAALREAAVDQRVMTPLRLAAGLAVLAAAVVLAVMTVTGSAFDLTNLRKVIQLPLLLVAAFALLLPVPLPPLVRWMTWPLSRLGAGGTVVRASALAGARRTVATATAVMVMVGVAATFLVLQDNAVSALTYQAVSTDRAGYAVVSPGGGPLPPAVVASVTAAVRRLPGAVAAPVGQAVIYLGTRRGEFVDILNADVVAPAALPGVEDPAVVSGSLRRFGPGSLIVDERTAQADGLRPGAAAAVWGPGGRKRDVTIAAVIRTGLADDVAYVGADAVAVAPSRIDIRARPGTDPAAALRAAVAGQPAVVVTRAQLVAQLTRAENYSGQTTTLLVLGIALAYSLLGVANTMVLASSGRRRELAALELAGATRRQVLGYVAAESLIAVAAGTLVAAAAGAAMLAADWAGLHAMIGTFPVSLPWAPGGAVLAACAVMGVLAATVTAARGLSRRPAGADA